MNIRVFGQSGELVFPFGSTGPWRIFANTIEEYGNHIVQGGFEISADLVIVNYHNKTVEKYFKFHKIPKQNRVLVIWEPEIVDQTRYKSRVLSQYGKVFAASTLWAAKTNSLAFNWPQDGFNLDKFECNYEKRNNLAVMIQGNKFSSHKDEMYSLRRSVLAKDKFSLIHLYGTDWNKGFVFDLHNWFKSFLKIRLFDSSLKSLQFVGNKFKNYKGKCADKNSVLSKYKIAIVIENSSDFVSEKLFDAVRSGCLTIYIGPNLNLFGLNNDSFITVERKANSILTKLNQLLALSDSELEELYFKERTELITHVDNWLNTEVLEKLAKDSVLNN